MINVRFAPGTMVFHTVSPGIGNGNERVLTELIAIGGGETIWLGMENESMDAGGEWTNGKRVPGRLGDGKRFVDEK